MDDGNWKTVRSHAEKQQKQAKKKAQKAEEKEEEDDGPIMIDAPRVGSVTQWHAFEAHVEAKRKAAAENERRNKINREAQKAQARQAQEAVAEANPKTFASAQLILFFNDPAHVTKWIEEARSRYHDSVEAQLRLIAGHLEEPFENVREKERGLLLSNPLTKLDLPYTSIPRASRLLLEELVENAPSSAAVSVFWFLFDQLHKFKPSSEVSGIGMKMMLQCIARRTAHVPALLQSMRANLKPFVHNNKFADRTIYDITLWIFGQIAVADPPAGLTLWFEYLLPVVLEGSDQAADAFDYIDFLFGRHLAQLQARPADVAVAVQAVGRILAHLGSPTPNPRLQAIFPLIQKVTVLRDRASPRAYFTTVLAHAGHKNAAFRPLVLELLFASLELDSGAFETWRQYYTRFIAQSNNLVFHIFGAWEARAHKMDKKELARVLRAFISMNKAILDESYKQDPKHEKLKFDHKEVRVCLASCQTLLQRVEGNTLGSLVTIGVLLTGVAGAFVWNTCIRNGCTAEFCETILAAYCAK